MSADQDTAELIKVSEECELNLDDLGIAAGSNAYADSFIYHNKLQSKPEWQINPIHYNKLKPFDIVQLNNLKSKPQWNKKICKIIGYDSSKERYQIEFEFYKDK
eukprot:43103_1